MKVGKADKIVIKPINTCPIKFSRTSIIQIGKGWKKFELSKIILMEKLDESNRQKKFELPKIFFYLKKQILFYNFFFYVFTNTCIKYVGVYIVLKLKFTYIETTFSVLIY